VSAEQPDSAVTPALAIATVAVVIGFADLPYGYYMLLRLALCGISLFLLFGANLVLTNWHCWTLGASAVLYNPLLPIRLGEKSIWVLLNVATVVLFWMIRAGQLPATIETSSVAAQSGVHAPYRQESGSHNSSSHRGGDPLESGVEHAREAELERLRRANDRL
jgi:hypothetical protein